MDGDADDPITKKLAILDGFVSNLALNEKGVMMSQFASGKNCRLTTHKRKSNHVCDFGKRERD